MESIRNEIIGLINHNPIPISPKRFATSQHSGEWPSPSIGKGFDFRNHREYVLGDDPRSIHTAMTVRTGKRMVVERIAMRDITILVVLDCSYSMGLRHKADMLLASSLMLLMSAVGMEMRVGAAFRQDGNYYHLGFGSGKRHVVRLMTKIEEVCEFLNEGRLINTDLPRVSVNKLLPASGIFLHLSDFLRDTGYIYDYSNFSLEARRYDYIPVVLQDEFEHSFPDLPEETMIEFMNPETGYMKPIWIGQRENKLFKSLNEERFTELKKMFSSRGIRFVHIFSPGIEQIHKSLTNYFLLR